MLSNRTPASLLLYTHLLFLFIIFLAYRYADNDLGAFIAFAIYINMSFVQVA